jgi:hypothetical protein
MKKEGKTMYKVPAAMIAAVAMTIAGAAAVRAADATTSYEPPAAVDDDGHSGVKIGYLSCDIGQGGGYVLGSAKELDCVFRSTSHRDRPDHYSGVVKKLGIDLGYTAQGKLVWAVIAPTAGYHHGSLKGIYVGASAEATVGAGIGANVLLGGTGGSIQLQPLSLSGQLGLNVAAASTTVTLTSTN